MAKESTKLWSEICQDADPEPEDNTTYQFSNGRRFKDPKKDDQLRATT